MRSFSNLTISILGCGWLGFSLAKFLIGLGTRVKGSTTTPAKIPLLKAGTIEPFLISASPDSSLDSSEFFKSDILFLNIPFKRSLSDPAIYEKQIAQVLTAAQKSPIKFIIFTSSTAVYPDTLTTASEEAVFTSDNPRSATLLRIEESLQSSQTAATILRFAGLYGEDRKIGKFLAGKESVDGQQPVNLVHLEDCIAVVTEIIRRDIKGEIFNVCSDCHPTRQELYTKAAIAAKLPPPVFKTEGTGGKIVSNQKLKEMLNYRFKHPDPLKDI